MIIKKLLINESNINTNEDILLTHIAIDYIKQSDQYFLLEKYGLYDGCKDLTEFILKRVKNKYKQKISTIAININKSELKKYNNIFFDEIQLIVNVVDTESNGGYDPKDNNSLNKDNLFYSIKLNFDINHNKLIDDLRALLYHELTHAYNNYCIVVTNKDNLYNVLKKQHYYNFISGKSSYDDIKQILSDVLYHINKTEQNAYIAELHAELENNKNVIHGPQEALDIIKKSVVYKNIITCREIIYGLTNNIYSTEIQDKIYDVYRNLNSCDWTDNQIKKKLINQIDKYLSKVEKTIPKMCLDFLNNNMETISENHNRKLISFHKIIGLKEYIENGNEQ